MGPGNRYPARDSARAQPQQPMGERVLEFMQSNPNAWRVNKLAARLRIGVAPLCEVLQRLRGDGKLVCCTVSRPGEREQEEYRIAAHVRSVDLYRFKISEKKVTGPSGSRAVASPRREHR